jgi:anti-anti-sigma regulatory factor
MRPTADPILVVAPPHCALDGIPSLARRLSALVAGGYREIVVDGRHVQAVDGTLPGLLARTHRQVSEDGGRLVVVAGAGTPVGRSIVSAGWDDVVEVFETVDGAVDACRSPGPELGWFELRRSGRCVRLLLHGEWDLSNVHRLEAALRGLDGVAGPLEVDLEAAGFIDLATVGCLRRARQARQARGGSLRVVGARGAPLRVIQLSGQTELLVGVAADALAS